MPRQIVVATRPEGVTARTSIDEPQMAGPLPDEYSDKLLKLIPAEVIGIYLSMHVLITDEVTSEPLQVPALGQRFALFRDAAGAAHCLADVCGGGNLLLNLAQRIRLNTTWWIPFELNCWNPFHSRTWVEPATLHGHFKIFITSVLE